MYEEPMVVYYGGVMGTVLIVFGFIFQAAKFIF